MPYYRIQSLHNDFVQFSCHNCNMALPPPVFSTENLHLHAISSDQLETRRSAFQLEFFCHSCMCRDGPKLTKSPRTIFHFVIGSGSFRLCPFKCLRRAAAAVHGRQDIFLLVSFPGHCTVSLGTRLGVL